MNIPFLFRDRDGNDAGIGTLNLDHDNNLISKHGDKVGYWSEAYETLYDNVGNPICGAEKL